MNQTNLKDFHAGDRQLSARQLNLMVEVCRSIVAEMFDPTDFNVFDTGRRIRVHLVVKAAPFDGHVWLNGRELTLTGGLMTDAAKPYLKIGYKNATVEEVEDWPSSPMTDGYAYFPKAQYNGPACVWIS